MAQQPLLNTHSRELKDTTPSLCHPACACSTTVAVNRTPHALRLPWQGATARSVDCDAHFDRARPASPLRRSRGSDPRGDRRHPSASASLSRGTRGRCTPSRNPTRRTALTANEVGRDRAAGRRARLGYHEILRNPLYFGEVTQDYECYTFWKEFPEFIVYLSVPRIQYNP